MAKITYLPGEVANAAVDENGKRLPVTRTQHIFDDALNKPQSQVNTETTEAISEEVTRAQAAESGLDTRLQTVEELAEISVGGGNIGIGTAADFESDDPSDLAKVPTVGAVNNFILDSLIKNEEMDEVLGGDVAVYLTDANNNAVLDDDGKPIEII